ncbi:MAG TPA: hypothetical protein VK666_12975 [Chryseolinea sp.]|nr:hypothetical protein [Chryseolinea sp.]
MSIHKTLLVISFLALSCHAANCQGKSDVFKKEVPITWLGLDFTNTKLIGDRERFGSESDVRHLLEAWNSLILQEPDKFDVAKAVGRAKLENVVEVTNEHNAELDVMSMFSDSEKDYLHVKPADVEQIIAGYDYKGKTGIGLMFVVESFNKINEEGSIYVTFINMDSKEVLFTERLVAEPKGFGMRNFWAGCVYGVITKIQKKEFEMWRKKYFRP